MAGELKVRPLGVRDRDEALRYLDCAPRLNLPLIDLVSKLGMPSSRGKGRTELLAAFRGRELAGVAALQPSMTLDAAVGCEVLEAFFPYLAGVGSGLVKSSEELVEPLWEWLRSQGRRALLDRIETGYVLEASHARLVDAEGDFHVREARYGDLDLLVDAGPDHGLPLEIGGKSSKRVRIGVDDGHLMALARHEPRQHRSHPAAAQDYQAHHCSSLLAPGEQ